MENRKYILFAMLLPAGTALYAHEETSGFSWFAGSQGLHPLLVHFPIALFICSLLFLGVHIFYGREIFREVSFWMLFSGLLGTGLAILTGNLQEDEIAHNEAIHELMETHETISYIVLTLFGLLLIWMYLRKDRMSKGEAMAMLLGMLLSCGVLSYQADLGGQMVYGKGAGVAPMQHGLEKATHERENEHNDND